MSEMSVSDARERFAEVIDTARSGEVVYVTKHGNRVAVVLDSDAYERLIDELEEEEDRRAIERARAEGEWIPWEQVKADLGLE